MTTVELLVIMYGSWANDPEGDERFGRNQRRVEITLNPILPADFATTDVKHTSDWHCEFCTKPVQETIWMNASWLHLTPPRLVSYVHNVCDAGTGPCAEQVRQLNTYGAGMSGSPLVSVWPPKENEEVQFLLSSSCAFCNNETEESCQSLQRCSKCRLIRYCSIGCQRKDWTRHKMCCKVVQEAKTKWYPE
ncbi:MYND-type domain-containing protein [Mycena venus]|uniref:MYND-type domain-containing protein n=1 Tax=Mycena venus TaxID=2733690 RepID=A0A8H6Z0Z3_9AGAR|nr:MYND-type domain-containing protein [Mycena venus]